MDLDDFVEPEVAAAAGVAAAVTAALASPGVRRTLRRGAVWAIGLALRAKGEFEQMVREAAPGGKAAKERAVRQTRRAAKKAAGAGAEVAAESAD
jgi:hypothetical protein